MINNNGAVGLCRSRTKAAQQMTAQIANHPYPFASDPVRQMAERDLTGNCHQTYRSERPGSLARRETDLDQILRLMDLDRIPGEQTTEIAGGDPPKAARPQRSPERPVNRRPGVVHDVCGTIGRGAAAR